MKKFQKPRLVAIRSTPKPVWVVVFSENGFVGAASESTLAEARAWQRGYHKASDDAEPDDEESMREHESAESVKEALKACGVPVSKPCR